jgi:hypothetical protein
MNTYSAMTTYLSYLPLELNFKKNSQATPYPNPGMKHLTPYATNTIGLHLKLLSQITSLKH